MKKRESAAIAGILFLVSVLLSTVESVEIIAANVKDGLSASLIVSLLMDAVTLFAGVALLARKPHRRALGAAFAFLAACELFFIALYLVKYSRFSLLGLPFLLCYALLAATLLLLDGNTVKKLYPLYLALPAACLFTVLLRGAMNLGYDTPLLEALSWYDLLKCGALLCAGMAFSIHKRAVAGKGAPRRPQADDLALQPGEYIVAEGRHRDLSKLISIVGITGGASLLVSGFLMFAVRYGVGLAFILTIVVAGICIVLFLALNLLCSPRVYIAATNKAVHARLLFGVRVTLPLDSVSSVGRLIFRTITVGSSSGRITVFFIHNNIAELHSAINGLILNRGVGAARETQPEKSVIEDDALPEL